MISMGSGTPHDPGEPGASTAPVHGAVGDDSSAAGLPAAPLATAEEVILASDLIKLMSVVRQATLLYNALEHVPLGLDWGIYWQRLGDALGALGLEES